MKEYTYNIFAKVYRPAHYLTNPNGWLKIDARAFYSQEKKEALHNDEKHLCSLSTLSMRNNYALESILTINFQLLELFFDQTT